MRGSVVGQGVRWSATDRASVVRSGSARCGRRLVRVLTPSADAVLAALATMPRAPLRSLPELDVPRTTGIYALWHGDELLYVGIAVKDPTVTTNPQAAGVAGRLGTYRRCRLTSDFTIAVAFRFVVPSLSPSALSDLADGSIGTREIRRLTQAWVADHVSFAARPADPLLARAAESIARRSGLPGAQPPSFNAT